MIRSRHKHVFSFRITSNNKFDTSNLEKKFPLLSEKEITKRSTKYLTTSYEKDCFVVYINKFYTKVREWKDDLIISKIDEILDIFPVQDGYRHELNICIIPEIDQYGFDVSVKILNYLSSKNIHLIIGGKFILD